MCFSYSHSEDYKSNSSISNISIAEGRTPAAVEGSSTTPNSPDSGRSRVRVYAILSSVVCS